MHDCAKDVVAFHDEEVTLLQPQRNEMRDRRNANRTRLKTRLKENERPTPKEFIKQGSYAMLTMVQDSENDYDIDDGVYFDLSSLKDKEGRDMPAKEARQMVCDALKDERFNKQPQARANCARIFYQEGYHVDMPIYRINDERYELAAGDLWTESRAADAEDWFNRVNQTKSPDENNGRQFRRIVRLFKKFARSRKDWKDAIAPGFTITKLVEECYVPNKDREDSALRETMKNIYNRLVFNLEVNHPVTPNTKLTKGPDDDGTKFLKGKLNEALKKLEVLDDYECSRKNALNAWDDVFNTDFFSGRYVDENNEEKNNASILANLVATKSDPRAVEKHGGDRFA